MTAPTPTPEQRADAQLWWDTLVSVRRLKREADRLPPPLPVGDVGDAVVAMRAALIAERDAERAEVERMRTILRRLAIYRAERMEYGGTFSLHSYGCKVCGAEWKPADAESHAVGCAAEAPLRERGDG